MVAIRRMAVVVIARLRRAPAWAVTLDQKIDTLTRKVNLIMALDTAVLNRILAGAGALVEAVRAGAQREDALKAKIAELESAEAAEDVVEAGFMENATKTADAMDVLLKGPETPTVEVPAPAEAPAVVEGSQEPVVTDTGPSEPESL